MLNTTLTKAPLIVTNAQPHLHTNLFDGKSVHNTTLTKKPLMVTTVQPHLHRNPFVGKPVHNATRTQTPLMVNQCATSNPEPTGGKLVHNSSLSPHPTPTTTTTSQTPVTSLHNSTDHFDHKLMYNDLLPSLSQTVLAANHCTAHHPDSLKISAKCKIHYVTIVALTAIGNLVIIYSFFPSPIHFSFKNSVYSRQLVSSLPSEQSLRLSQCCALLMHWPFEQVNCDGEQVTAAVMRSVVSCL